MGEIDFLKSMTLTFPDRDRIHSCDCGHVQPTKGPYQDQQGHQDHYSPSKVLQKANALRQLK